MVNKDEYIYTVSQKNETRVILNTKSIARKFNVVLAIRRVHNLPPHLSYVSTLPDITKNRNYVVFFSVV